MVWFSVAFQGSKVWLAPPAGYIYGIWDSWACSKIGCLNFAVKLAGGSKRSFFVWWITFFEHIWLFPDCGGGLWAVSKVERSVRAHTLLSEVYPAVKLQWHFPCGFDFRHSLRLPFVATFAVLKGLIRQNTYTYLLLSDLF